MVNVVITYNKGTGIPETIRGELIDVTDFEYRLLTTRGREFGVPKQSVYRTEWLHEDKDTETVPRQTVVQGAKIVREAKTANTGTSNPTYSFVSGWQPKTPADTYATKLDIPSTLIEVWDDDGSKWTRGDFSEFWYCVDSHHYEMDAYGPFTKENPES